MERHRLAERQGVGLESIHTGSASSITGRHHLKILSGQSNPGSFSSTNTCFTECSFSSSWVEMSPIGKYSQVWFPTGRETARVSQANGSRLLLVTDSTTPAVGPTSQEEMPSPLRQTTFGPTTKNYADADEKETMVASPCLQLTLRPKQVLGTLAMSLTPLGGCWTTAGGCWRPTTVVAICAPGPRSTLPAGGWRACKLRLNSSLQHFNPTNPSPIKRSSQTRI